MAKTLELLLNQQDRMLQDAVALLCQIDNEDKGFNPKLSNSETDHHQMVSVVL